MTEPCLFCGNPERVTIHELYDDGTFVLDTCCISLSAWLGEQSPEAWRELLLALDVEGLSGHRLRSVVPTPPGLLVDYRLTVRPVPFGQARTFVARHHAHNAPPAGWRFGAAVWNGYQLLGVVMVGRPVARAYAPDKVVEVSRLCLRRDLPSALRKNAASMLYAWAAKEARRRGFLRIQTYTLFEVEPGTSLRAAGWVTEGPTRGGSWHRASRPRVDKAPTVRKERWSKFLGKPLEGIRATA